MASTVPDSPTLGVYPTPIMPLARLSAHLGGASLWIKRDDLTGLAFGGNKTRKLEPLIADALASGADTVISAGAQQSNHCRQCAAACAKAGLRCHLVLGGKPPATPGGNYLLDRLLGATIHHTGSERKGESIARVADELQRQGARPYVIPYGGSNAIGASAFVDAAGELKRQIVSQGVTFDRIVFPSSSGGTQAGLMVGKKLHDLRAEIIGIAIDKGEAGDRPFAEHVAGLAAATAERFNTSGPVAAREVILRGEYLGAGYGIVGDLEREAISLTATLEGILLDPVYTGRAMGALIDLVRRKEIPPTEQVLFWHTGGAPAIFAYAAELTR